MEADGGSRRRAHVLASVGGSCGKRLVLEADREGGREGGKGGEEERKGVEVTVLVNREVRKKEGGLRLMCSWEGEEVER